MYREPRGLLEEKSLPRERVGHEKADKALVIEGKSKSAFSLVPVPRVISCNDMRTNVLESKMGTPMTECNTEQGKSFSSF